MAQVELLALFRCDAADTKIISKIRCSAGCGLEFRDRLQPSERSLKERRRRHKGSRKAAVQRLQYAADQTHVVIGWQPTHAARRRIDAECVADQPRIMHKVGMGNCDAFWRGR